MGDSFPGTTPPVKPPEHRWEKREGMPVHRHLHDKLGSVYASRAELDGWARGRNLPTAAENGDEAPSPSPAALPAFPAKATPIKWTIVLPLGAVIAALAIGGMLWLRNAEY